MPRRVRSAMRIGESCPDQFAVSWASVQVGWRERNAWTEQSQGRFVEIGGRFVARLIAAGVSDWGRVDPAACQAFVTARTRSGAVPSAATQRLRRSVVRAVFRELRRQGLPVGDPTLDLPAPPRPAHGSRPLTDGEIELGRVATRLGTGSGTLLRAVAWALAEAGAASSEIGRVRLGDLDDLHQPRAVTFVESQRFAGRTCLLTDWGQLLLTRHLQRVESDDAERLLAYGGRGGTRYLAQASVATGLTKVLDLAGLRADPLVHARSVRAWAGRSRYDRGESLEQVAAFLGQRSLDRAAGEIGVRGGSGAV